MNNPPCSGLVQDRLESLRLSSQPKSSLASYLLAQLQARVPQPSIFLLGTRPPVLSDRFELPRPTLEEDLTIGPQRHKRTELSAISGRPLEEIAQLFHVTQQPRLCPTKPTNNTFQKMRNEPTLAQRHSISPISETPVPCNASPPASHSQPRTGGH